MHCVSRRNTEDPLTPSVLDYLAFGSGVSMRQVLCVAFGVVYDLSQSKTGKLDGPPCGTIRRE